MSEIPNRRAIVDRKALIAEIEALAEDSPADALRPELIQLLRRALKAGREEAQRRLESKNNGIVAARAQCYLIDQILRCLYDFTLRHVYPLTNPTKSERMGVVAVGGYGRGELAPFSDVDLLFLLPYKQTPWGEQVVEYMLYVLWDLGLKVGHATRSVDECVRLAKADITIRTAVLERRFIWGDRALYDELDARFETEVVAGTGPDFVEAKLAERDARHQKVGDSRYLVEPNLKEGKGGLRDLHTLFWIAKYVYRVKDASELVKVGVLTAEELGRFVKAERFLWTVRCHLHALAGRPEERLTFDAQPELARRLGYADRGKTRGVERFMKHYFLVAKDVGDLTRIFCAHLEEEHKRKPRFRLPRLGLRRRTVEGFPVDGEWILPISEGAFEKNPVEMIRIFHAAQKHGFDIHPKALREIRASLPAIDKAVRENPEANALFIGILTSRKDPEKALKRMNEAGVFGQFIPDFGRVVAQMQHDMYHVFTVDEHTIRAIGILADIESGQLAEDHPVASEILPKVASRRVLYVATLLHDIAKGRGGDHSVLGAKVAEKLCPRLGFSASETETVAWLVRYHLLMSAVAFKRDIADPKTVADFAEIVQSPERLKLLLALTVADIRAVGPGIWNGWKGQLLRDLYYRAEEVLQGGLATQAAAGRVAAAQAALGERLKGWSKAAIKAETQRHYESYWLSQPLDSQERNARLIRKAEESGEDLRLEWRIDEFHSATEITIYTQDHPGLFARLAAALAISGASIVDAKISTTKDGMALDTFWIQDSEGKAYARADRLSRLATMVKRTLAGEIRPREVLAEKRRRPKREQVFTVKPQVFIDNVASDSHTVIEVNGRDRAGLLADLTYAINKANLSISSAHIATFGERAVDVFYVRDLFGHKVTHASKLRSIERRLLAALEEAGAAPMAAE